MKATARASLDIFGRDLRYAEVEQLESRYRLLRLGSCDFDFDIVSELLRADADAANLTAVREALRDVLSGSVASTIRFVLHPPAVRSFMAALPGDLPQSSVNVRVRQEAALLFGVGPGLTVDHELLDRGASNGSEAWYGVNVTLSDVRKKLTRLSAALPGADVEVVSARNAAGRAVERYFAAKREKEEGVLLAIGLFGAATEIVYGKEGRWIYSHSVTSGFPTDGVYQSAEMLRRLGHSADDVSKLLVFGEDDDADFTAYERFYRVRPQPFDPLMLVNIDPSTVEGSFQGGAFLTAVGGAL
jgi:hypothetical protein